MIEGRVVLTGFFFLSTASPGAPAFADVADGVGACINRVIASRAALASANLRALLSPSSFSSSLSPSVCCFSDTLNAGGELAFVPLEKTTLLPPALPEPPRWVVTLLGFC